LSFFRVRKSKSGFSFESRTSGLLGSLQFNVKESIEFDCINAKHKKNLHEFDHLSDFLPGRGQLLPSYAKELMAVSCKMKIRSETELKQYKTELMESIECYKKLAGISPNGLMVTSSVMPDSGPNLNDGVYFWDLTRCFFYGWKAYFINRLKTKVNYYEQKLFQKNTFVFGADDPEKIRNVGECEIFYDSSEQLDKSSLERCLTKILHFIQDKDKIKEGLVYVNVHTINGFNEQVLTSTKEIEANSSANKIKFEIENLYDYSIVPWDPVTKMSSKTYSGP